jgi:hypothetical protein
MSVELQCILLIGEINVKKREKELRFFLFIKKIDLKNITIIKVNPFKENEARIRQLPKVPTVLGSICQFESFYR